MDGHSRGHRRLPKGFPIETETKEDLTKRIMYSNTYCITDTHVIRKKKTESGGPYLIADAYKEPCGDDLIEALILQRDFIID